MWSDRLDLSGLAVLGVSTLGKLATWLACSSGRVDDDDLAARRFEAIVTSH